MLIFERTFLAFEFGGFVFQGVDDDSASGCSDNGHRVFDVCAVGSFRQIDSHDRLLGAGVPELKNRKKEEEENNIWKQKNRISYNESGFRIRENLIVDFKIIS